MKLIIPLLIVILVLAGCAETGENDTTLRFPLIYSEQYWDSETDTHEFSENVTSSMCIELNNVTILNQSMDDFISQNPENALSRFFEAVNHNNSEEYEKIVRIWNDVIQEDLDMMPSFEEFQETVPLNGTILFRHNQNEFDNYLLIMDYFYNGTKDDSPALFRVTEDTVSLKQGVADYIVMSYFSDNKKMPTTSCENFNNRIEIPSSDSNPVHLVFQGHSLKKNYSNRITQFFDSVKKNLSENKSNFTSFLTPISQKRFSEDSYHENISWEECMSNNFYYINASPIHFLLYNTSSPYGPEYNFSSYIDRCGTYTYGEDVGMFTLIEEGKEIKFFNVFASNILGDILWVDFYRPWGDYNSSFYTHLE